MEYQAELGTLCLLGTRQKLAAQVLAVIDYEINKYLIAYVLINIKVICFGNYFTKLQM